MNGGKTKNWRVKQHGLLKINHESGFDGIHIWASDDGRRLHVDLDKGRWDIEEDKTSLSKGIHVYRKGDC